MSHKKAIFWIVMVVSLISLAGHLQMAEAQALSGCPTDMTSYWKLDEPGGPLFTDSLGTSNAGCTGSACPSSVPGRIGNALGFDGIDDALTVPADASFNWGSSDSFSVELWMKASSCVGYKVFAGRRDNATISSGG